MTGRVDRTERVTRTESHEFFRVALRNPEELVRLGTRDSRGAAARGLIIALVALVALVVVALWIAWTWRSNGVAVVGEKSPSVAGAEIASSAGSSRKLAPNVESVRTPTVESSGTASDASSTASTSHRGPRIVTVDEAGTAIAGATIELIATGPKSIGSSAHISVTSSDDAHGEVLASGISDARGEFVFDVSADVSSVLAAASTKDGRTSGAIRIRLPQPDDQPARLVLRAPAKLRGRVVDSRARPIEGAEVSARMPGVRIGGPSPRSISRARTSSDGAFELAFDDVGARLELVALLGDRKSSPLTVDTSPPPKDELVLTIELGPPPVRAIDGVVVDEARAPVAGATVLAIGPSPGGRALQTTSAANGAFHFDVAEPGEFCAIAKTERASSKPSSHVQVGDDEAPPRVELALELHGSIRGHVVHLDGSPVVGVPVVAYATESRTAGDAPPGNALSDFVSPPPTDSKNDGSFEIAQVAASFKFVVAAIPDPNRPSFGISVSGVEAGAENVQIVIDPAQVATTSVSGDVIDVATGEPANNFSLLWCERGPNGWSGSHLETIPNAHGHFRLEHLAIDHDFCIELMAAHAENVIVGPWHSSANEQHFQIEVGRTAPLVVEVHRADGSAAIGASVRVIATGDVPPAFAMNDKTLGEHAVVRLSPIAFGKYTITAALDGLASDPLDVELGVGRSNTFVATLRAK